MSFLVGLLWFVFGTIVGSFLNVLVLRHNTGRNLLGRSACFSCGRELGVIDLVPLLSFLMFRGRCRTCGSKISWQYPLVEAAAGLVFLAVYLEGFPFWYGVYLLPLLSLLLATCVYDFRHKIIPDRFAYTFAALSLFSTSIDFSTLELVIPELTHLAAGPLLALPFAALWFFSRGRWMGLGDAKLTLGIGWLLGLSKGVAAVLMGVWVGALVGVLLIGGQRWLSRRGSALTMKSEIPFGPFLVVGFLIALFFNVDFFTLASIFDIAFW